MIGQNAVENNGFNLINKDSLKNDITNIDPNDYVIEIFPIRKALTIVEPESGASSVGGGKFQSATLKLNFTNNNLLKEHFNKHGGEFQKYGVKSAQDYLSFGRSIINEGTKVNYSYKGEIRTGYVQFMGNNSRGDAKFVIVGTNNQGNITTIHTQIGKDFWRTINGK